jgi:hypothetical protein
MALRDLRMGVVVVRADAAAPLLSAAERVTTLEEAEAEAAPEAEEDAPAGSPPARAAEG